MGNQCFPIIVIVKQEVDNQHRSRENHKHVHIYIYANSYYRNYDYQFVGACTYFSVLFHDLFK